MRVTSFAGIVAGFFFIGVLGCSAWGQVADGSWAKFQGDARNSGATSIVAAGGSGFVYTRLGDGGVEGSGISVGPDGTAYSSTRGGITAIGSDGVEKWSVYAGYSTCTAAVGRDGTVYYGSPAGSLCAINPDGSIKWGYDVGASIDRSSPTLDSKGNVYFGSTSGNLWCFNAESGNLNWERNIGAIYGSPAIGSGDVLYTTSADGYLYAFDSTGQQLWRTHLDGQAGYSSPSVGADGTIYVGTTGLDSQLYAVDAAGAIKWTAGLGTGTYGAPAIGHDGNIYLIGQDSALRAFSASGSALWSYTASGITMAYLGSPIIDGAGTIYFTARCTDYSTYLFAVNPDATELWRKMLPFGFVATPAIGPNGEILTNGGAVNSVVPEPSSLAGLLLGAGVLLRRRRLFNHG